MLLVGIIIIAGVFSFVPVEQATTLHGGTASGVIGFYIVEETSTATESEATNDLAIRIAECDDGDKVTGGGPSQITNHNVPTNSPLGDDAWKSVFQGSIFNFHVLSTFAVCADFDPPH